MAFTSPTAALDAIKTCLEPVSRRIHTGPANSGAGLPCCDDSGADEPLIRIETYTAAPKQGQVTLRNISRNRCGDFVLTIDLTYQTCWNPFDGDGPEGKTLADSTAQGLAAIESWWAILARLVCCDAITSEVRFESQQDLPTEGGCAGWTMRVNVDVSMCDCSSVG